jgi:fatty acid desaturase
MMRVFVQPLGWSERLGDSSWGWRFAGLSRPRKPGERAKLAAWCVAAAVVLLPLALLLLAALIAGAVTFVAFVLVVRLAAAVSRLFADVPRGSAPQDDGRRNVTVIPREP